MIVAGIDIGSRATKTVIMDDGNIISSAIIDTGPESIKTAYSGITQALASIKLSLQDIKYTVATGYGRVLVPFASENISEISCHAKGINYYFPEVKTILDMGGQDCKAINCDDKGTVTNFVMNDKCAGGTGRFLEMIADVLNTPLTQIGEVALSSKAVVPFNTVCAVFARSEAIGCLRRGIARADILAGLNDAIAVRCLTLLKKVALEKEFTITGGIAKNKGMVAKIQEKVGLEPRLCPDPQLCGALGAALFARDRCYGQTQSSGSKVHYGYSDGTGDYYISIDGTKCNGCGECVTACPAGVLEVAQENSVLPAARVKENRRKKLAIVCPGYKVCSQKTHTNCHNLCKKEAINHSW
jgi:predicted CoA-substrate-specific enzyme activase